MIRFITTIIVLLLSYFSSYAKNKEPQQLINELHQEIKVVQLSYFNIDKSLQAKKLIYKHKYIIISFCHKYLFILMYYLTFNLHNLILIYFISKFKIIMSQFLK